MVTNKPEAGSYFPSIHVKTLDNRDVLLTEPSSDPVLSDKAANHWTLIIVYRGQHCPICTNFLNALDTMSGRFLGIKVDIVAVSADSAEQLQANIDNDLQVTFPLLHGLQVDDMKRLGVYISDPMSNSETDHPFSEPALFVLNEKNQIQLIDIASGPWARPNIDQLFEGLTYARDNHYPIRGKHTD